MTNFSRFYLKVYILRDSELMKFVFTKPPPDVKPILADFRQSVEQSLELPLTLNLYESQFYSRDGALDFSSTRYTVNFFFVCKFFI
jgi:hypothetical protein